MEITLEMVDQVRERTGCTYEEAKAALEQANGSVVDALIAIEKENSVNIDVNEKVKELGEKVKEAVAKGNANRIRILRGDEELANIPVNAGIAGGLLGILAGPGVLISAAIAGVVAKFGFNCRFELVRDDGSVEELFNEEQAPAAEPVAKEASAEEAPAAEPVEEAKTEE